LKRNEEVVGRPANTHSSNSGCLYQVVLSTSNTSTSFSSPTSELTTAVSARGPQHNLSQASFNIRSAEELVLAHHTLPTRWLLIDSCLTIDIALNANLLHEIHQVNCPT
jgi:hypothetical protein